MIITLGCGSRDSCVGRVNQTNKSEKSSQISSETKSKTTEGVVMKLYINDEEVDVNWENNSTVEEIIKDVKSKDLTVQMSMYGGFEQVGDSGKRYTQNDKQITTKSGDKIVVFYGSNTWNYTKLGEINKSEEIITNLLSKGNIKLKIIKSNKQETWILKS